MQEKKRKVILSTRQELTPNEFVERAEREGIELEKGAVITNEYLERHKEELCKWVNLFTAYPDYYLDIIKPADSEFRLFFYQRFTLRALMRFKDVFITAPRAFSKSFVTILALFLQCVFIPGRKVFMCANTKQQAAQITKEKIYEIYDHWPLLKKEIIGWELNEYPGNFGKDYVTLNFRNGSKFDVVLAGDAARGGRRHGGEIDEIRDGEMSPSYNAESFATEYLSLWQGSSEEAWFSYEKLTKYRKLKNPEMHAINRPGSEQFYLISVDVGRISDQTAVSIFRVNIVKNKFYSSLVNLIVLGRTPQTKPFTIQAIDLKKIIERYGPREVVIDTNGLGVGLADEMIKPQYDEMGNYLPAYGFINDENYKAIQPKDAPKILYGIKANNQLNSKIHGNCYSRLTSGLVRFLIKEQEAKSALLSTKKGQKMTVEQRVIRLMPHEMTTKLFEEMANLRLKRTGASLDIVLERINSRFPKDKYSSFSYGLWRIKELEEDYYKTSHRRRIGKRQLVFFSGGR